MAENEDMMQNLGLQFGNIEFSAILVALALLLFSCLQPQKCSLRQVRIRIGDVHISCLQPQKCSLRQAMLAAPLTFGREMSTLLKGIACIFILMSHYVAIYYGTGLPDGALHYVQIYAANIALVWFMFCSGYGLTLKKQSGGGKI